jgi:hypothetical protein
MPVPQEKQEKIIRRKETGPWTPAEYAALFAVSRATVYNWLGKGWLGSSKIGGCRRILPIHDENFRARFTA